jgi:diacylglycerol kinase
MRVVFLLPAILLSIFLPLSYFYQIPNVIIMIFFVMLMSSMRWNVLGRLSNQCYSSKNRATAISSLSMMISLTYIMVLALFSLLNEYTEHSIKTTFLIMGFGSIFFLLPISLKLAKKYHNKVFQTYD